jgi:hypothetical protein
MKQLHVARRCGESHAVDIVSTFWEPTPFLPKPWETERVILTGLSQCCPL